MLRKHSTTMLVASWAFALLIVAPAQGQFVDATAVTAEIRARQEIFLAGHPMWVDFTLFNPTDQVAVLYLRGSKTPDLNSPEMGLPLSHVLDGGDDKALLAMDADGREIGYAEGKPQRDESVAVRLAPQTTVGRRVDISAYFSTLRRPGKYKVQWRPYEGAIRSNTIDIQVASLKQARIETDYGPMTMRLFYEDAPRHVENFIELAQRGFYDNLTFHRLVERYLIQGGAPNEEPAAIRPDGTRLKPEFNDNPFIKGTVGMARRPSDPASASCQFFICDNRWPELDGQYTAFAQLIGDASFATLEKLMASPVDSTSKPLKKLYIRSIHIEDLVGEAP